MTVKTPPFILCPKGALMLLDISVNGVSSTNARGAPPQHIVMPALAKFILRGCILTLIDIPYHPVNETECFLAFD
jgi:hypothetical protein